MAQTQRSVPRAASALLVGRLATATLGYVGSLLIVRHLSPADWGAYTVVFSLLGIVGVVAELQMSRVVLVALRDPEEAPRIAGSYAVLRLIIGLCSYGIAMLVVVLAGYPRLVVQATAIAGLVLVLANLVGAVNTVFQARYWFRASAVGQSLGQLGQFAALAVVVVTSDRGHLLWLVVPALLNEVVDLLWLLWVLKPHRAMKPSATPRLWGRWLSEVALLAVGASLAVVYARVDSLLVSKLQSIEAVGYYGIGYKFADLASFLPVALTTPVLTHLVESWPDDRERFHRTVRQGLVLMVCCAVGVAGTFSGVAREAISLAYGTRYETADSAAVLLVIGAAFSFVSVLSFTVLLAVGRNRPYVVITLVALILNVAVNLVVIPAHGYQGAAAVTVGTEAFVAVCMVSVLLRVPGVRPLPLRSFAITAIAGVVLVTIELSLTAVLPWGLRVVLGLLAFLVVLHVLKVDGPGGLRALAHGFRETDSPVGVPDEHR